MTVDFTRTDLYEDYDVPDEHVELTMKVLRTLVRVLADSAPSDRRDSYLEALVTAQDAVQNMTLYAESKTVPMHDRSYSDLPKVFVSGMHARSDGKGGIELYPIGAPPKAKS